MADEESSQTPSGDPKRQPPAPTPSVPLPQQGIVPRSGEADPDQSAENSRQLSNEIHWLHHATFWSQVGLGIIGICALVIYYGQLRQMTTATEASTKSVEEAQIAMINSQSQFDRTMNQMLNQTAAENAQIRVDQRAWLWMELVGNPQWETGKTILATMNILDSGKTAALNVHAEIKVELLPVNQPPDFIYKTGHHRCTISVGFIFPGTPYSQGQCSAAENTPDRKEHILTENDRQLFSAGKVYVAYHGLITYKDAFGFPHWVQFCEASSVVALGDATKDYRGIDACQSHQETDSNVE